MRQFIFAALAYFVLQLFVPHWWERLMSEAPPIVTQIVFFIAALACVAFAATAAPVFLRLSHPSIYPVSSTTLAVSLLAAIGATAWWQFAVSEKTKTPSSIEVPISLTGLSIDPKPYVAGKVLHVNLRINSIISDLKVMGGFKIWTGTADDAALKLENRQLTEDRLWKEFEAIPPVQKIPISWTRGEMISVCDGPVLTQEQVDRLNGENGIVYIMGQIDYGDGALDFGGYVRTANPQVGILAVEHNGSAKKRFYEIKPPPS